VWSKPPQGSLVVKRGEWLITKVGVRIRTEAGRILE
jgi:hypothetical protein